MDAPPRTASRTFTHEAPPPPPPQQERNVALGIFYLAIPVGAALGYAVGGILGETLGWKAAFLACGVPGGCWLGCCCMEIEIEIDRSCCFLFD